MSETRRLGKGLGALLGPISKEQAERAGDLRELPIDAIGPNPLQPRRTFDETALAELASSIEASGILQPVVVRPRGERFELIAGERRWRAAKRVGLARVPAVVREVDDTTLLTLALIENLQRHDLSAIDEALGYQRLQEEFAVPQAEIARLVGKSRSAVANGLRLLKLPEVVQGMVHDGRLSEGHARALLGVQDASRVVGLAERAAADAWSVRTTEEEVRRVNTGASGPTRRAKLRGATPRASADARRIEDSLRRRLGTDVHVGAKGAAGGSITIRYYSNDDLARLLELILGRPFDG